MTLWAKRGSSIAGIAISNWPVRKLAAVGGADLRVLAMPVNLGLPVRLRKRPGGVA
jgi:hypothetical protein